MLYKSANSPEARRALKSHYCETVNLYRFLAGFRTLWRAAILGWEHSGHPAMHHFGWDAEHLSIDASMRQGVRESVHQLKLPYECTSRLLEVGCGLGGNILQSAREFPNGNFIGITLVPEQAALAQRIQLAQNLPNVSFLAANMLSLPFPDHSFNALLAFESFSHIPREEKPIALREFFRVLVPGGRFVMVDGYLSPAKRPTERSADYQAVLLGLTLAELVTADDQSKMLVQAGFLELDKFDYTERIWHFAEWLYWRTIRWSPVVLTAYTLRRFRLVNKLFDRFGFTSEQAWLMTKTGLALWRLIRDRYCTYHLHIAAKPA